MFYAPEYPFFLVTFLWGTRKRSGSKVTMGRPRATSSNREFALAFANYVTAFSDNQFDWVARKGRQSIFELLKNLAPKVHSCENLSTFD
jgi:hypothetical protein